MTSQSQLTGVKFNYVKAIGNAAAPGQIGFRNPVDVAMGPEGQLYVLSHAAENTPSGKRIGRCTFEEEYFLGEFGSFGEEEGQFTWPNSLVVDSEGQVYVTDEWLHRVTVYDGDGNFLRCWGVQGSGAGEWKRPSGIAIDREGNLLVVDSMNHRIQKYSRQGEFLEQWGGPGNGPGEFNTPWGIATDGEGCRYVADWRNDRVQKLGPEGEFILEITGEGGHRMKRPSGVAVDEEGLIYAADWGNDRVLVFDAGGGFAAQLTGDAGMSKWGADRLSTNPESMLEQRAAAKDLDQEKLFVQPTAVKIDPEGHIFVVDSARHRLQVYQKANG